MKNLENLGKFQELSSNELESINGGLVCGGFCMFALGVAVGVLIAKGRP
ncbi:class IIb bacteriocin, lactobin A/cerein 7B family [Aquimarina sp. 2201CG1-2-11]